MFRCPFSIGRRVALSALAIAALGAVGAAVGPAQAIIPCEGASCRTKPPVKPACSAAVSPGKPYQTPQQQIIALSGVLSCASAPLDRVDIRMERSPKGRAWRLLTTRQMPGSILKPLDRMTWRNSIPYQCLGARNTSTYRVRMVGYKAGRVVVDRAGPGVLLKCPSGVAEGVAAWTHDFAVSLFGNSAKVPAGALLHRISGEPPFVGSDYASFRTAPGRMCNWRIDFVYSAEGVVYERNRGNTNVTCNRDGKRYIFPKANKRFGSACAELYKDNKRVVRQCHPIALRAWSY